MLGIAGITGAGYCNPVQLSVFDPVQIVKDDQPVTGMRLGLVYTVNTDVSGFSLTLPGMDRATGNFKGFEAGLISCVGGEFRGWQAGIVSHTANRFAGFQSGLISVTGGDFSGLQVGLCNYNGNKEPFEFLPLVNWSF